MDDPEQTFTTQTAGTFTLPDGRAYEMVSPSDLHGALLLGLREDRLVHAAAQGGAIAYLTYAPVGSESPSQGTNQTQILATRGPGGWRSRELGAPHEQAFGNGEGRGLPAEGWFFSEDLSRMVLQPYGPFVACHGDEGAPQPCLSPAASEQTPFLEDLQTGTSTPLVTGCPVAGAPLRRALQELADVPPGTILRTSAKNEESQDRLLPVRHRCCAVHISMAPPRTGLTW